MQVSVEKISNIECRLTIVIPAGQVEEAYSKQINQFAQNASIKGFRPGKVPVSYIEKRFGEQVRKEAISDVIQTAINQAITEKNLKPVGTPQVVPKILGPKEPLEIVASFEVLPEIEKINFSLDNIEKPIVQVLSADVDNAIMQLQKQSAKWNSVDRPAKEKDRIVISYYPIYEGKEDLEQKVDNLPLELGSRAMIPGFEEGLIGVTPQEKRSLHLQFPDDYHVKEKAGKPVNFEVEVKQVYEGIIPTIDEEFVKSLGIQSGQAEDLKNQIKETLEINCDRLIKQRLKEQVFTRFLEQNPLDVPKILIERVSQNIHDEMYQQQEHHHEHSDNEMVAFNAIAKKRIAVDLLIKAFAKQANLVINKEQVRARVKEIAAAYENPAEVTKWLLSKERVGDIESQVLEDQVLDKLLEGIPVTEKPISYDELTGRNTVKPNVSDASN